jgi:hypothetical protein
VTKFKSAIHYRLDVVALQNHVGSLRAAVLASERVPLENLKTEFLGKSGARHQPSLDLFEGPAQALRHPALVDAFQPVELLPGRLAAPGGYCAWHINPDWDDRRARRGAA